jgi:antirestriction protein ArdC
MDSQNTNTSTKLDVYQLVTDRIIELLEAGTVPWQKPWNDVGAPMNLMSKRPYRGINLWLLLALPYERNLFLTWDQLKKIGGSVNKDEHGHIVVFWKNVAKKPEELGTDGKPKTTPMLRYYKVFNVQQCKDIPLDLIPELVNDEVDPLLECEGIINTMPNSPTITFKESRAFYDIEKDLINMPKKKSFASQESYYSTLFHEIVHSTGAKKRLGRKSITDMAEFGSESYSLEELIAELGASYLCGFSGILEKEIVHSAEYLAGWLGKLRNDKKFIIQASGHAQKAVDLILNRAEAESKDAVDVPTEESMVR